MVSAKRTHKFHSVKIVIKIITWYKMYMVVHREELETRVILEIILDKVPAVVTNNKLSKSHPVLMVRDLHNSKFSQEDMVVTSRIIRSQ